MSPYEKLVAYQLACEVADAAHAAIARWDRFDRWTTGVQLLRAADSVAANIAEGSGRTGAADRRRMFTIARGSFYETEHFLSRARARGLDVPDLPTADLARTLNGLIRRPVAT